MLNILCIIALTLLGAFFYRARGGPLLKLPRPFEQILFSSFPCLILPAWAVQSNFWVLWVVFIISVAFECTGHGGFFYHKNGNYKKIVKEVTDSKTEREPERLEFLIRWLHGRVSNYLYCTIGMAMTGFVVTLGPGIFVVYSGQVLAGVFLALTGLLKAPAYMISDKIGWDTHGGEWISGGLRWFAASLIFFYLID